MIITECHRRTCHNFRYEREKIPSRMEVVLRYRKRLINGLRSFTAQLSGGINAKSEYPECDKSTCTTSRSHTQPEAFVKAWLLNGFHTNTDSQTRLNCEYIRGEASILPTDGRIDCGRPWFIAPSRDAYCDLGYWFRGGCDCAAYGHTCIYSPSEQTAYLRIGSTGGVKVWANGTVVLMNDTCHGYTEGEHESEVHLVAGWNRLLVKVNHSSGNWGFSPAICHSSGDALPGLTYCLYLPPQDRLMAANSVVVASGTE